MKNSLFCATVFFLFTFNLFTSFAQADWIPLKNPLPARVSPEFACNDDHLSVYIHLPGFYQDWSPELQRYAISIPGAGHTVAPGAPRLPVFSCVVALPCSEIKSIRIHYTNTVIYPHVPVIINTPDSFDSNCSRAKIPAGDIPTTEEVVKVNLQNMGKIQGWEIFKISICPFAADLATADLHAAENFKIELHYSRDLSTAAAKRPLAPQWSELLDWQPDSDYQQEEIPPEYLVITPALFVEAISGLANWRMAEGMEVTVKTIDDIKREMEISEPLCADKLQAYLSLYYNRRPNLTYVLLVGDVEFIPVKYKNDDGTDLYYSLLDGTGDRLPDIYLGRLPANNAAEVRAAVEKIITYEKSGPSKRVLLASYFQDGGLDGISDRDYVYTSELFRSFLVKRHYVCGRVYTKTPGSTPAYYSNFEPVPADITFDGKTRDIIDFINIGVALVNHRDHGTAKGWDNPSFKLKDLDKLWNTRYPILFNVDCETGKFDKETEKQRRETEGTPVNTQAECFGERLLFLPERGMVAVIAPSRETTNSMNNVFDRGLMGALWPRMFDSCHSPSTRLGQALYRARITVVREFGGNGWVNERVFTNFRRYNLLGDPALRLQLPQ